MAWLRTLLIDYAFAWTLSLLYCLSAHIFKSNASAAWVSAIGGITGFLFINYLLMRLKTHMAEARPYLNANLTVEQLARQLGIPSRELSQAINQALGKNFFEVVSDYRITEACRQLEAADTSTTILQVMYDSGFNSSFFR